MGRYWVRGEAQRPAAEACVSGRMRVSAHLIASIVWRCQGLDVIRFAAPLRPAGSHTQIRGEKWRAKTGNSGGRSRSSSSFRISSRIKSRQHQEQQEQ